VDRDAELPNRPEQWTRRRRSPRNHDNQGADSAFPPTPPRRPRANRESDRERNENVPPPPSPPRRRRRPPPRQESNNDDWQERDYIAENVGKFLYDSLKILGLGLGASEAEVKTKYRALSRVYHPDKHDSSKTNMTDEEASDFFKLINNAQSYLREVL